MGNRMSEPISTSKNTFLLLGRKKIKESTLENEKLEESNSKLINNLKLTLDEHDIKEQLLKKQDRKIYELENKIKIINPSYTNLLKEKEDLNKKIEEISKKNNKITGELEYYYHRMLYFQEKNENYKNN